MKVNSALIENVKDFRVIRSGEFLLVSDMINDEYDTDLDYFSVEEEEEFYISLLGKNYFQRLITFIENAITDVHYFMFIRYW